MFVRKKPNPSGSTSIQIIDKSKGKFRIVKTVGVSSDPAEIAFLWKQAHHLIPTLSGQGSFDFMDETDRVIIHTLREDRTARVHIIGHEKILGEIFNRVGFNEIEDELFRHLVLSRIICPVSKLATTDYLHRYAGVHMDVSKVYRFMDKLQAQYKERVERIAYQHTQKILKRRIGIVFYDMTTLYFEAEYEDELRRQGFSKDGRPQNPQILLGLLVSEEGYPIGYEIFPGNQFEGDTLVPVLEKFQQRYQLNRPIIIADSGLLSKENTQHLSQNGYEYILGARIKNESEEIKKQILELDLTEGEIKQIRKQSNVRLLVGYADARARKDAFNRQRGLQRLEKKLNAGKLTKSHINNKGYNKYLKLSGEITLTIDYDKFHADAKWDGLKGYLTNCKLPVKKVVENYNQLWQIEKAFRISKHDLRVRPVFHHLPRRIEAHICIAFCAYTIFKELERMLYAQKASFSTYRAIELLQTMYALTITLPGSQQKFTIELPMDDEQDLLCQWVQS
jgi:transposase